MDNSIIPALVIFDGAFVTQRSINVDEKAENGYDGG